MSTFEPVVCFTSLSGWDSHIFDKGFEKLTGFLSWI
ncbi:60S ribosomal protein L16 [Histoplasma capsulatum]|uniref:60S ribosomal protein L16 n=1 Tax=Ajellomyces capsulatus TaxID=5037 RepID=A0A8A1MFJ1_AJECA|nr:60S ribosomal protein L16 [Histoplasma capsulatum]